MKKYDTEIDELKSKLFHLESERDKFLALPEEQRLAETLHDKFCSSNHTDGCDWFYDTGDWTSSSRKQYRLKAKTMLKEVDFALIEKVVNLL